MERLASCYNDKIIEPLKDHNKPKFVKAFRLDVKRLAMKLKGHKIFHQGEEPSFTEFLVTKVLNEDWGGIGYGSHWAPYYKECAPCTLKYDFIGLLDPTMEETKFIWDAVGINSSTITLRHSNSKMTNGHSGAHVLNKNKEKLAKLYQTVPRATLIEVYKKYKYDYELFGFDFNNVLKLAGYHTLTKNEETMEPEFYKTQLPLKL